MGYSKIVKKSDTRIVVLHQLGSNGERYAEDVIIDAPAGRLDHLAAQDGKVGVFSFGFTAYENAENATYDGTRKLEFAPEPEV